MPPPWIDCAGGAGARTRTPQRPSAGPPEIEAGGLEVTVEGERRPAAPGRHHREAHRVRVADRVVPESREPLARGAVILGPDELDREPRARLRPVERAR